MKSFFKIVAAVFVALLLFLLLLIIVIAASTPGEPEVKKNSYLIIDYDYELYEYAPPGGIEARILGPEPENLQRILTNLKKAAVDKKIKGIILRIHGDGGGYAMLEEARNAIVQFRESNKKVYAFATNMSRKALFLASACDSIIMPPSGYFTFTGFNSERFYIKNLLEKIGLKVSVNKIKDYKTAAEILEEEQMTPEAREMAQWILDEIWSVYMETVARARNLTFKELETAMEKAVFTVNEAKEAKLIDAVLYWDALEAKLKLPDDKRLNTVSMPAYAQAEVSEFDNGGDKKIAVIHAQGLIAGRNSGTDPMLGITMGYQSMIRLLRQVQFDEDVVAVIFRINSGGGDHLTSDLIGHQVGVLDQVKPVVISMVDVAASGGYSLAFQGRKLVANNTSITGSIGSIMAMANARELYHKLGITKDYLVKGPETLLNLDYRDVTRREWQLISDVHWQGYEEWLAAIAQKRNMDVQSLRKLADGRVWSGRQALDNGLIDEIGGLDRAIEIAKELVALPEDEEVAIVHYPKHKSIPEMIFSDEETNSLILNQVLYYYLHREIPGKINYLSNARLHYWNGRIDN